MRLLITIVLSAVVALMFTGTASAQTVVTLHVDGDATLAYPTGTPIETDWTTNPFKYLSDALEHADFLIESDEADFVDIWIKGDTADPYRPTFTGITPAGYTFTSGTLGGPATTTVTGSFSDPIADIEGGWDEYGAWFEFVPWTGTDDGNTVSFESIVPYDPQTFSTPADPGTGVFNVQGDSVLSGTVQNGPWSTPIDFINVTAAGSVVVQDFEIINNDTPATPINDGRAVDKIQGHHVAFRRGRLEARFYAAIGVGPSGHLDGLSFVGTDFVGGPDSGGESVFRVEHDFLPADHEITLLVFGGETYGPIGVGGPMSAHKQTSRLHGVDNVVYAFHTFHRTEAAVGITAQDDDKDAKIYQCRRAVYYECTFNGQHPDNAPDVDGRTIQVGDAGTDAEDYPTEVWFISCEFLQNPPTVTKPDGIAYFLNCTLDGVPYDPNASFVIVDNVTLRGGFAGTESNPGDRVPGYETRLSGDLRLDDNGVLGPRADNVWHVVRSDGLSRDVALDRITIDGGYTHIDTPPGKS